MCGSIFCQVGDVFRFHPVTVGSTFYQLESRIKQRKTTLQLKVQRYFSGIRRNQHNGRTEIRFVKTDKDVQTFTHSR